MSTERVDLKVGFRCNNLCDFCVQGDKRLSLPSKSAAELEESLREGFDRGARSVVFTGGEPTLHKEIVDLVSAARRMGFSEVQLQSNGRTFCYAEFCKRLIDAGVTEFGPSLHGSKAEIHDGLTRAPGSFKQTVAGIRNLKSLGQRVITNSVVTKPNAADLPALARLLVSLGVDQFQLAFVHIDGRAARNKDRIVERKSVAVPYIQAALDIGRKAGTRCMAEAIPYCLMKGYEDFVAEKLIPQTVVFDAHFVVPDYTSARRNSGKAKGPRCSSCAYDAVCEGPWKEYPEIFGWDEFVPVKEAAAPGCGGTSPS